MNFDLPMRFLLTRGLGALPIFQCMDCRLVFESYWKIQVSSRFGRNQNALSIISKELRHTIHINTGHGQTNRREWLKLCVTVEGSPHVNAPHLVLYCWFLLDTYSSIPDWIFSYFLGEDSTDVIWLPIPFQVTRCFSVHKIINSWNLTTWYKHTLLGSAGLPTNSAPRHENMVPVTFLL